MHFRRVARFCTFRSPERLFRLAAIDGELLDATSDSLGHSDVTQIPSATRLNVPLGKSCNATWFYCRFRPCGVPGPSAHVPNASLPGGAWRHGRGWGRPLRRPLECY
jgi:hypothetical protein